MGLEQILDVLADTGAAGLILPHALPEREEKIGTVLMLEQQIDLIHIDPGIPLQSTVSDDAVEDAVQHHQHSNRQKLLTQIPDVIAKNAGVGIHIGGLGEGVEAALGKQLDGQCHIRSLLLRLAEQLRVEVLQGRGLSLIATTDVVPIDLSGAAVNDRFLPGRQLSCPDELLTEGQQKLGFQHHGIFPVPIALLHIHGVDVVGRGGGDVDDLAAQPLHQRAVLGFGINDDYVILGRQRQRHHLLLGAEGLSGARDA